MDHDDGLPPADGTSLFLVERFWPGVTGPALRRALVGMEPALEVGRASGHRVRHVRTLLVVLDETILSIFEAGSMESVRLANDGTGWPYDRILEIFEL